MYLLIGSLMLLVVSLSVKLYQVLAAAAEDEEVQQAFLAPEPGIVWVDMSATFRRKSQPEIVWNLGDIPAELDSDLDDPEMFETTFVGAMSIASVRVGK